MKYLSVCSGIEAASVAWWPLDWEAIGVAEIDSFCKALLAHRFPDVLNYGDFTCITGEKIGTIDLVVGGTPCQDFSVAGLRAGLGGERGRLTIEFVRLLERIRPRWMVWENVPGVLSSDGGWAFGTFLRALGECGYGFAYRILDAQYFGVPQRRRRVFIVGYFGDWRPPAAVLFERESLRGDFTPRSRAREIVAAVTASGVGGGGGADDNAAQAGHLIAHTLRAEGFDASEDGTGRGIPLVPITFANEINIRRITPREAERLQGFPDDYTLIPYRGSMAADSPRYRALGNSMAVPVMRWIGERIMMVERIYK